jgi:oligopeptide transport system substrate-binding protein
MVNQEWKVYLDSMRKMNYQIARRGWIGDYNDPNTFLDSYTSKNELNSTGFASAKYDELIKQAANERNAAKRLKIFQQAEDILMDELPIIPIYIEVRKYLLSHDVENWYGNIEGRTFLKGVKMRTAKTTDKS